MFLVDWPPIISSFAAILTAIGGCVMAYAAVVSAKHRAAEECQSKLRETRAEAESMADELHRLRIERAQ